ncbi:hypothetical protein DID88_008187 [Monilinia fructigena]|uniref:Uncharacterized protein n=1 Tax=Monilinia fructigena TaxID=38457 RepID=A0A395J4M1_9HELO|nr:hypothetical protein DID88_008187 [Monilinia fructigena]
MSFLASLFALDVKSFPHENGNLIYTSGFIFSIIFGTIAAISIPAIIYAFFNIVKALIDVITSGYNVLTQKHSTTNRSEKINVSSKAGPNKNDSVEVMIPQDQDS